MAGMYPGSARQVGGSYPVDIVLLDSLGNPVFGFDSSRPAGAAITAVPYVAGSVLALPANANRRKFIVANPTNKTVFLAFGATASLTAYTIPIASNGAYESDEDGYTGDVSVIWQSAPSAGPTLHVTEVTTA